MQACTSDNTTLTCTMLAQNATNPGSSKVHVHRFPHSLPPPRGMSIRTQHRHRTLCASCARANLTRVLTRLLKTLPTEAGSKQQLSFGVQHRLSTERLIAAHLHRTLCGANDTCPLLSRALPDSLRRGHFMPALLGELSAPSSALPPTDALWNRNWVFCPHTQVASSSSQCMGSVPKTTWLNPRTRVAACAEQLSTHSPSSASINFCLLNQQTEKLCSKMQSWIQRTEFYLCQAAGLCEESDFFYSPTTFNLQEQEFVYDTVLRFYVQDAGLQCPAGAVNLQTQANEAEMQKCASVSIAPILLIIEQLRTAKRSIVLLFYHTTRVSFRFAEVFVAVQADTAASMAQEASNAVQAAAEALLRECTALMLVIGDFVETIGSAVLELAMSKGVGSTFKEIVMALCSVVEWIYNNLWAKVLCPIVQFVLEYIKILIDVWETVVDVLRSLGVNVHMLDSFIEFVRNTIDVISSSLNECTALPADICVLGLSVSANAEARGVLPMPTRCWSSYVTFFGDNQQLSCSVADTCKLSSLSSERIMCGACPVQSNPSIQDFACDYVTSICTCAVPQLRSSSCLVNEDCMLGDSESSCMLINDNLELSRSAVACSECQFQSMCFHTDTSDSGVCACGRRQRVFQLCTAEDTLKRNSLSLMLHNLCIYSQSSASFYDLEFQQVSVIPCQLLDPTTASCAYVVDMNIYAVRGSSRAGRRLLSADVATYTSLDPACRDALLSDALPHTRASCQTLFDMSTQTLQLLRLEKQLPPCALCSVTDAIEATRSNPLAVLRILSSSRMLITVFTRHGPAERAVHLLQTLQSGVMRAVESIVAADASALVTIAQVNGTTVVHVDEEILPPAIASALAAWVSEMLLHDANARSDDAATNTTCSAGTCKHNARRLLFFRELILAVETRVRSGWGEVDRLHEAFAQSVTQILTYRNMAEEQSVAAEQWGPAPNARDCTELQDLLRIAIRTTKGIRLGWQTLTHERNTLQRRPTESFSEAWALVAPSQQAPADEIDSLPEVSIEASGDDPLMSWAANAVNATLDALDVRPSIFYNALFSLVSAANTSFTCSYEAVQTCSNWRVRLWQGVLILLVYFSVLCLLLNAVGLTFLGALLVPFFSIIILQLCYGYEWTCLPMVPVCSWQDFHESLQAVFPLTLELPDDLKNTTRECLVQCQNFTQLCLPRYPTRKCTMSCKNTPFGYTSASHVVSWVFAEFGSGATDFVLANQHYVPFLSHQAFDTQLRQQMMTYSRASGDLISAHRICVVLSAYMLVPYLLLLLILLGLVLSLISLLSLQLFPLILLFFSLFTAASVDTEQNAYDQVEPEQEKDKQQDSTVNAQDISQNSTQIPDATQDDTEDVQEHVVDMP